MSDFYISPTGAGDRSGSSLTNAATISSLNVGIKTVGSSGGKVLLLADAGSYTVTGPLNIYAGGSAATPVTVTGISTSGAPMAAHFEGTRATTYVAGMPAGNELFKLLAGANNLVFENVDVANTGTVFRAGADISNVTIQKVTAQNVKYFFDDIASGTNKTATVSGLAIKDVNVTGFSGGVARITYDSHDILIDNVKGNSLAENGSGDDFAIGIHLLGTVHDAKILRTTMANAVSSATGYWNGDGFATEGGVHDIYFEDDVANGNGDGGFDLKSTATTLVRPVSFDNAHNIRIWGNTTLIDPTLLDPHIRGGTGAQLQVEVTAGATATITGGLISDSGSATSVLKVLGTLNISGTGIVHAAAGNLANAAVTTMLTDVHSVSSTGTYSTPTRTGASAPDAAQTAATASAPAPISDHVVTDPLKAIAPAIAPAVVSRVVGPTLTTSAQVQASVLSTYHHGATIVMDHYASYAGSNLGDHFETHYATTKGTQVITGFGANDVFVTNGAIFDSDHDTIIPLSATNKIKLGENNNVQIDGVTALRYLGVANGDYVYANASTKLKGLYEGTVGNDTLNGDDKDKAAQQFFFDNALDVSLGNDRILGMGKNDVIVTTHALATGTDGKVHAGAAGFALHDDAAGFGDVVRPFDLSNHAVTTLESDGSVKIGGIDYYVYSLEGSAAGLANLHALGLF